MLVQLAYAIYMGIFPACLVTGSSMKRLQTVFEYGLLPCPASAEQCALTIKLKY